MTRAEFVEKIENGSDIMFDVRGKHFTILTWPDDGIAIDEQYPNDGNVKYFRTVEELVDGFFVDGKPIANIADEIRITEYT